MENQSIIIRTKGNIRYEFLLMKEYVAIHMHGLFNSFTPGSEVTFHRKFWNQHYISMETVVPYHIAIDILNNPKAIDLIKERLDDYEEKNEPLRKTVLIWVISFALWACMYIISHIVFFALDHLFTIQSVVGIFITIVALLFYLMLIILTKAIRRIRR